MNLTLITDAQFEDLLTSFEHEAAHLETRDTYGTATELPHLRQWEAGEPDDLEWLQGWCATLRDAVKAGKSVRRARIISEPLNDYQRWSYSIAQPMVDAGEDIRWVPRKTVSSIAIPGNDFYLFDNRLVVYLSYSGNGLDAGKFATSGAADIQLCSASFEAVWKLAIPHREYGPR